MAKIRNTVRAVAIIIDGQDGGGRTTVYPDLEQLRQKEFFEGVDMENKDKVSEAEEKYQSALNGDNPYEDGEIDQSFSIELDYDDEYGEITLAKDFTCSWGQ